MLFRKQSLCISNKWSFWCRYDSSLWATLMVFGVSTVVCIGLIKSIYCMVSALTVSLGASASTEMFWRWYQTADVLAMCPRRCSGDDMFSCPYNAAVCLANIWFENLPITSARTRGSIWR